MSENADEGLSFDHLKQAPLRLEPIEDDTQPEAPAPPTDEQIAEAEAAVPEDIDVEELSRQHLAQLRVELEALTDEDMIGAIATLRANNQQQAGELAQEGMQLEPLVVMMQRLESLIQFGLPERDRLRVDMMFERQMAGMIQEAAHQARVAKLTQGLNDLPQSAILRGGSGLPQPRKRH
jgi:hypothetical protein